MRLLELRIYNIMLYKALKLSLFVILCSVLTVNAKQFEHPYVRIYTEGVVTQNIKLNEEGWQAITQAADYTLVRVKAALDEFKNKSYAETKVNIDTALHLLTLIKIATPTFQIREQVDDDISISNVQSLSIISHDEHGKERVIDIPLLFAFLVNAQGALQFQQTGNTRLFLENALESASYEDVKQKI